MSYTLLLIARQPGADPEATARAYLTQPETGRSAGPIEPQKEARKERLVRLLQDRNPDLTSRPSASALAAEPDRAAERRAHARDHDIELTDTRSDVGVAITLHDDSAAIAVPFWHKREDAGVVFDDIWDYLKILTDEGDMVAYDPQLDRVLDLSNDKLSVVNSYAGD